MSQLTVFPWDRVGEIFFIFAGWNIKSIIRYIHQNIHELTITYRIKRSNYWEVPGI